MAFKVTTAFRRSIERMLNDRATRDQAFAAKFAEAIDGGKSITECCEYIASEVYRKKITAITAQEVEQATNEFAIRIAPYIGLRFTTEALSAFPLPTVEDFRKEGEAMHHCVFENAYYKRPESLIFSVRKDERRLATVEVNLNNFSVVQIRGPFNSIPEEEGTIYQLFSSHMWEIQKIRKNELHS